jgi:hypothetical protein
MEKTTFIITGNSPDGVTTFPQATLSAECISLGDALDLYREANGEMSSVTVIIVNPPQFIGEILS